MRPKYKATGCFRFFVFFIIFIPVVFFGAAFIRGENGVTIIKEYYHKIIGKPDSKSESGTKSTPSNYNDSDARIRELEKELKEANERIHDLEEQLKKNKQ